jgi:hypothetical protein
MIHEQLNDAFEEKGKKQIQGEHFMQMMTYFEESLKLNGAG